MCLSVKVASIAILIVVPFVGLSADTLFKKSAAVAIGFGTTQKGRIRWADCSHQKNKAYVKPPYWVDKSDNCHINASAFGLDVSGQSYVAKDVGKVSTLFPDIKQGDVVDFKDVAGEHSVILTFKNRSVRLAYGVPPSEEQIVSNELSVAVGFAEIGKKDHASELLEAVNQEIMKNMEDRTPASGGFFTTASMNVYGIKTSSPALSNDSQTTWLRLAEYRSALEEPPRVNFSSHGSIPIIGGPQLFDGDVFDFGVSKENNLVLKPGPDGKMPYHILVKKSFFRGGAQVLDGIYWDNVTFVRTHISYEGGQVFLRNVSFVNCTFNVVNDPRGDRFLDFATRKLPQLVIGTENDLPPEP